MKINALLKEKEAILKDIYKYVIEKTLPNVGHSINGKSEKSVYNRKIVDSSKSYYVATISSDEESHSVELRHKSHPYAKVLLEVVQFKEEVDKMHLDHHPGINKFHKKFNNAFYFPCATKYITAIIKNCGKCMVKGAKFKKKKLYMAKVPVKRPNHSWQMDYTHYRGFIIFSNIDIFSKYLWMVVGLDSENSQVTIKCLKKIFDAPTPPPKNTRCDNGKPLFNESVVTYLTNKKINVETGIAYCPECQGVVERVQGTIKAKANVYLNGSRTEVTFKVLKKICKDAVRSYNLEPQSSLSSRDPSKYHLAPYEVHNSIYINHNLYEGKTNNQVYQEIREKASNGLEKARLRMLKELESRNAKQVQNFEVDDKVAVIDPACVNVRVKKQIRIIGVAKVIETFAAGVANIYRIQWLVDGVNSFYKKGCIADRLYNWTCLIGIPPSVDVESFANALYQKNEFRVRDIICKLDETDEILESYLVSWEGWPTSLSSWCPTEDLFEVLSNYVDDVINVSILGEEVVDTLKDICKTDRELRDLLLSAINDKNNGNNEDIAIRYETLFIFHRLIVYPKKLLIF